MWFRLAKELGMSVARCQNEVSSAEFGEWVAYYSIEPFGERIEDIRSGTIASVIANTNRSKDTPAYKPLDFAPWVKEYKSEVAKQRTPEEIAASAFGINLAELKRDGTKRIVIQRPKS